MLSFFALFGTSRHATVITDRHAGFGLSITEDLVHFGKLPEAASDEEEGRVHSIATFIPALVAN